MKSSSDSENGELLDVWSRLTTNSNFDGSTRIHFFNFPSTISQFLSEFLVKSENSTSKAWLLPKRREESTDEVDGGNGSKRAAIGDSFHQTMPYSLLVQSLIKQLCNFIETDKQRSIDLYNKICVKLYEMKFIDESFERSEFENIRMSYELALKQLVEATRGNVLPNELEVWPLTHDNPKTALEWSRYFRDFEEMEKIGEGGFGDVWKSKHKLDGIEYAIKKICVKATSVKNILNHLREVRTLASLNHVHIVPYKSCWLEPLIAYHQEERNVETFQSTSMDESSNVYSSKENSLRLKSDSSFTVDFQYNSQEKVESRISVTSVESHSRLEKIRKLKEANGALIPHVKLTWAVLYIQMRLCQKTLRNLLDDRNNHADFDEYYRQFPHFSFIIDNEVDVSSNQRRIAFSMFHQLCNGLEYIHTKEIVHHDIKPSNVFITKEESGDLILQLGDFGLACPLEENDMVRHGFGTRLYAAKEQLDGKCHKKSDIYSLGVILIEILSKCVTQMECFKKVENIKKGEELTEINSECCKLIHRLLHHSVDQRPDISELKKFVGQKLESSTTNEINQLKKEVNEKDDELQRKDQEIEELKNEIRQLRRLLSDKE